MDEGKERRREETEKMIMGARNHFERLGLEMKETNRSVIRKAYRRIALKVHPDKNPSSSNATKAFQLLTDAFELLYDETDQKTYIELLKKNSVPRKKRRKKRAAWFDSATKMPSWKDVEKELDRRSRMEAQFKQNKSDAYDDGKLRRLLRRARNVCRNLDERTGIFHNHCRKCLVEEEIECEKPRDETERLGNIVRREQARREATKKLDVRGLLTRILIYLHEKHDYVELDDEMTDVDIEVVSKSRHETKDDSSVDTEISLPWRCQTCRSGNAPGVKICSVCGHQKMS